MAGQFDRNPFEEEEVNPFAEQGGRGKSTGLSTFSGGAFFTPNPGSVPSALSPLPHEGFYNSNASVDIPLDKDNTTDYKKKEKELQSKEAELRKREQEVKRREDAAARGSLCCFFLFFPLASLLHIFKMIWFVTFLNCS
ncbi:unnamed protein product [Cuscuta campestris]|uniref:Uncharacterized protein n=1 Tax=Cuscuta campestris TaxID=132261 RepID=A0A484K5C8_9ASTE|nr:unnamed protein product [Cuscuta campestris]